MRHPFDEMRENYNYEQTLRTRARTISDQKYRENPYSDPVMMEAIMELGEWENASPEEKRRIVKEAREKIEKVEKASRDAAIEKRIENIEELKKMTICYRANKTEITLWFETDPTNKASFRGNRFKYLAKLLAHHGTHRKMSFHELGRVGTTKKVSSISGSIGAINTGFEKITRTEKLIINLNGYHLNDKFLYKLVK